MPGPNDGDYSSYQPKALTSVHAVGDDGHGPCSLRPVNEKKTDPGAGQTRGVRYRPAIRVVFCDEIIDVAVLMTDYNPDYHPRRGR